jgi:3-hydroxyisobutyrate dehydrogenase-like beta-hydroxyacid dehydrogenase
MAVAAGIDMRTAVETIRTGGATNFFIDRGVENINTRGAPTQFALELAAKDATLLNEITASSGIPAPIAAAVLEVLNDAVARGLGDKDWGDLVLAAEAGSGLDLTIAPPKDA